MKRLVVCCDGTWQDAGRTYPTNVAKIAALKLGLDIDYGRMPCAPRENNHLVNFNRFDWIEIIGSRWRSLNADISFEEDIHASAKRRWRDLKEYRPANVKSRFQREMDAWIDDAQSDTGIKTGGFDE